MTTRMRSSIQTRESKSAVVRIFNRRRERDDCDGIEFENRFAFQDPVRFEEF